MSRLIVSMLLMMLSACATDQQRVPVVTTITREPFDCELDERCEQQCTYERTWQQAADGTGDWDELRDIVAELRAEMAVCDERRKACKKCIDRSKEAGALR